MITFHDILDILTSETTGKATYDCTTETFNQIIDYIAQRGIPPVTISDLFEGGIPGVFLN